MVGMGVGRVRGCTSPAGRPVMVVVVLVSDHAGMGPVGICAGADARRCRQQPVVAPRRPGGCAVVAGSGRVGPQVRIGYPRDGADATMPGVLTGQGPVCARGAGAHGDAAAACAWWWR